MIKDRAPFPKLQTRLQSVRICKPEIVTANGIIDRYFRMDEKLMRVVERRVQTVPVYSQECTLEMETPEALHKALYGIK